jgi:N4-gp56 family major capsid protein
MAGTPTIDGAALASTGTGGALTFKEQMSSILATEASNENPLEFDGIIGAEVDDKNAAIVRLKPLSGGGDQMTYSMRTRLRGPGVDNDDDIEGNEQELTLYSDSIKLALKNFPVALPGRMGLQFLKLGDLRKEAVAAIKEQGSSWEAELAITMLAGKLGTNYEILPSDFTGWGSTLTDVDATHQMYGNDATAKANLDSADTFVLSDLVRMRAKAKTLTPKVMPIKVGTKKYYIVLMHPDVVRDLKTSTATLNWGDLEKAKMQGGSKNSALVDGSIGIYHGCLLYEYELMPIYTDYGAGSNVRASRILFLGQQAGVKLTGKFPNSTGEWDFEEKKFQYGQKYGANVSCMVAYKPCIFNSKRFGMLAMDVATLAS